MGRSSRRALTALWVGAGVLLATVQPVGADVIDPPGACSASGTWEGEGVTRASEEFDSDDVIVIPQEDAVAWEGGVGDATPGQTGPERDISGQVEVVVAGVPVAIDDWDGPSELYGNSGTYEYDVPDVLVNVKMKLQGAHEEAGTEACSGSVYVKVDGTNPLLFVALIGVVLSLLGLLYAGTVKKGFAA